MGSSSRGGSARDRPSATAPMTTLLPTVKASRADADAASVRPPVIRRAAVSIPLWATVTADRVAAAMTPVAMAWSMVRRGCSPGSNDGPTDAAAANSATRSVRLRSGPNAPSTRSAMCATPDEGASVSAKSEAMAASCHDGPDGCSDGSAPDDHGLQVVHRESAVHRPQPAVLAGEAVLRRRDERLRGAAAHRAGRSPGRRARLAVKFTVREARHLREHREAGRPPRVRQGEQQRPLTGWATRRAGASPIDAAGSPERGVPVTGRKSRCCMKTGNGGPLGARSRAPAGGTTGADTVPHSRPSWVRTAARGAPTMATMDVTTAPVWSCATADHVDIDEPRRTSRVSIDVRADHRRSPSSGR